jgi:hypothetical protein
MYGKKEFKEEFFLYYAKLKSFAKVFTVEFFCVGA